MTRAHKKTIIAASITCVALFTLAKQAGANTRTLESVFALSADEGSEFTIQVPTLSPGRFVVEAEWRVKGAGTAPTRLDLILHRPDGTVAASKEGVAPLKVEYRATEQEVDAFLARRRFKWTAKITSGAGHQRQEVAGKLRITVPAAPRALIDTQFTLFGGGNAQEIPFVVPAPGRIVVETDWTADLNPDHKPQPLPLILSLIHPGQDKTHARRQGRSPLRAEHQVTEQELDKGLRWVARVQNDSGDRQAKARGRVKVIFTPSL